MKTVKIEVLKTLFLEDVVKAYGMEGVGSCPAHRVGDTYYTQINKPEGFCDGAWKSIYQYVFALSNGATEFYDGGWTKPGTAICSCYDGLRPVIFRVEAVEEEA